jgi:hypothetical protein
MSRPLLVAALAAIAAAWAAAPAVAHEGNPNFRSEIDAIEPALAGLRAQVLDYDDSIQLENGSGETVVIRGYEGEPYVRLAADGTVSVNTRSPAHYLNADRYGDAEPPAEANPDAAPRWQEVDRTGQYSWHDHRIHYMSTGTPTQVTDPDRRTLIFDYRVPLEVDGQRGAITGSLYWVGQPGGFPVGPFVGLGAAGLVAGALIAIRARRRREPVEEAW